MVDDQPAKLLSYEAVLCDLEVDCVRALSGPEALHKLLQQEFAVILLDVSMPGMDGFEVARLIREHPRLEKTPIIFITAIHGSELDRLKGYEVGAIDYICVPVASEILRSKVAILVELHQRRRELRHLNDALAAARAQMLDEHARALAASEAQLKAIFEHPTDLIAFLEAVRDEAGVIRDWVYRNANANTLRCFDRPREEIIGRRLSELIPERAQRATEICGRVLDGGEVSRYETHWAGRDLLVTIFPAGPGAVASVGVDISDSKRSERALRASERRYQALIEEAPVGVAHNSLEGRFEYVNKAFCALVGYSAEELYARSWQEITHPDDIKDDQTLASSVLAGEHSHYTIEKRYIRKDASTVWVRLFGNYVADDEGRAAQGVAIVVDVTERKQMERDLRSSRAELTFVTENAAVNLVHCDRDARYVYVNRAYSQRFGLRPADVIGKRIDEVVGPAAYAAIEPYVQRALSGERVEFEVEIPYEAATRFMHCVYVPHNDTQSGEVCGFVGVVTDITERRRLEEKLRQTDRRKDDFLAMLAHELRNPIAPITSASEALARLLASENQARELVDIVQRQTLALSRLLDDLLDVARITQGRIQLRTDVVALETCIDLALETAGPLIRERRHELTQGRTRETAYVKADRVRFAQCLQNLLTNAAKYTDVGGKIVIQPAIEGGDAVIEVTDNGIGIAEEFLPHVFELFAQSERSLDRAQGGLGIGLCVCQRLMEMQGGSVTASSAGLGRGSTFTLRIPLSASGPERTRATQPVERCQRILIVDDNRDAADALALLLELEGHETKAVYDAEAALREFATFAPQVALLDIGLPGMNGYELGRRLRHTAGGTVRLIALTGYGQTGDKERATQAGFDAHLAKPASIEDLKKLFSP